MEDLKLFTGNFCPYCIKVERFIKKNNIEDVEIVNINKDLEAQNYLIEKGGKRQIPCLFIDDEALYESNDIINYLQEKFL
ncbi:glutaredoxin family protein [Anaerosphaera multitolerans]|uniref:NrdH-redoxin n=1 Tax=Anaerosphaera multitolerans TaxID=2487351 RepID=A0A437S857_9FIRM|nr:glutaredoxin domain-containing protein [Anaerosphaera multitolerans]RVU55111.1 NrdH-redoxin [Anaerosphaera multitolerans]